MAKTPQNAERPNYTVTWAPSVESRELAKTTAAPKPRVEALTPAGVNVAERRGNTVPETAQNGQRIAAGSRQYVGLQTASSSKDKRRRTEPTSTETTRTPAVGVATELPSEKESLGKRRRMELRTTTGSQSTSADGRKERAEPVATERNIGPTLQRTGTEIITAQGTSRLVQNMMEDDTYKGLSIVREYGLVLADTPNGKRIVLPPSRWATALKEVHDSVWAGHLRAPHTYARMAQTHWWSGLQKAVKRWVLGCHECGSRTARPREVVPPLRSIRGGDVGD
ncbi:hypothetical protein PI124_g3189 [Phytophthora idaei]|nr:hypothetical protein PI125_g1892 [Phytophthora idaei]KAG3171746.1 hypothetical protein PI126_g1703 [Phytophthora idaei]KAG3252233.1 hypothetical protein PI124_g3189 [Phytophthora idaei]